MLEFRGNPKTTIQKPIRQEDLPQGLPQTKVTLLHSSFLKLLICLFLVLVTLIAYFEVQNNEFINLDDDLYVTDNPYVSKGLNLKGILWAFTSIYRGHWHPITWLSHMIDYNFYGRNPGGHHITNLLFHITNTLLLFLLLSRLTVTPWRSGFVAALFALHPLHVESVAWVAERKDVLSAFFWMLAMWGYVYYVQKPKLNRYLWITLCFILALMSKPMAVTLPFVLILLDYWPLGRLRFGEKDTILNPSFSNSMNIVHRKVPFIRLLWEKIPLLFLSAVMSLFTILAHQRSGALSSLDKLPLEIRIGNAFISYVKYISKMIWPDRLAVLYPHPITLPLWEVVGATLLLMIITTLVILAGRKHNYYIMGWFWYLGTLLPVIGLVQAGIQAMADRFMYIPIIGLFIMVVYGISDFLKEWRYRKLVLITSGGILLLILMIATMSQILLWRNSITLFSHTLQVTENNYLIHNNLGVTLKRQGRDQEASVHYRKALEINPRYSDAHYNLAAHLVREGKDQEAIGHFYEALKFKANKVEVYNDLGVTLTKQGRFREAATHFAEAIQINPNYAKSYLNWGILLIKQGKNEEAIPYFNKALQINPKDAKIHNNLGVALAATGNSKEAIAHYNQALRIDPNSADAHYNLGSLLTFQGKNQEALFHYYEVLRINPYDVQVHYKLANILIRQGKNQEAVIHLTEAIRIIPNYGEAHLALGMIYLVMRKKDLALDQYKILKTINNNMAKTLYKEISKH
jgi:tetratricopeptide (TPR) repeat protein